ncbi:hypothetical protein PIB30_076057, partial [Stylosanthes scabra]|nr:hypothetical protein [Stylosanthes scabra]
PHNQFTIVYSSSCSSPNSCCGARCALLAVLTLNAQLEERTLAVALPVSPPHSPNLQRLFSSRLLVPSSSPTRLRLKRVVVAPPAV